MSDSQITQVLERQLATVAPELPTSYENVEFAQPIGPFQVVNFLFAEPENPTQGDDFYRQRGIMQISLQYPINVGRGDAMERAELLRASFYRGLSLTKNGVTAIIDKTPEIGGGSIDGDRYAIVIRVRFFANIGA